MDEPIAPAPGALAAIADPARVVILGDVHGAPKAVRYALRRASQEDAGVIVQVGDFGAWGDRSGRHFLDEVTRLAARGGVPVVYVDGNHEDFDHLAQHPVDASTGLRWMSPWVAHIPRGHRWTWRGLTWMGLGGAVSVDRALRRDRIDWWTEETLTRRDIERAAAGGRVDVLVTHDCPGRVPVVFVAPPAVWDPADLRRSDAHRDMLQSLVDEVSPTHLFHGHIHQRFEVDVDLPDGTSCHVTSLDCDGRVERSVTVVDLDALAARSSTIRAG